MAQNLWEYPTDTIRLDGNPLQKKEPIFNGISMTKNLRLDRFRGKKIKNYYSVKGTQDS